MNIKHIIHGNSVIDIVELFYRITEMPRKKKKFAQKEFKKYAPGGYERLEQQRNIYKNASSSTKG